MKDDAVVCIHCGFHHGLGKVLELETSVEAEQQERRTPTARWYTTLAQAEKALALWIGWFYGASKLRAYGTLLLVACCMLALLRENRRLAQLAERPRTTDPMSLENRSAAPADAPAQNPTEEPAQPPPDDNAEADAPAPTPESPGHTDEINPPEPASEPAPAVEETANDLPSKDEPALPPDRLPRAKRLVKLALLLDPANKDAQLLYGQILRNQEPIQPPAQTTDSKTLGKLLVNVAERSLKNGSADGRSLAALCYSTVINEIDPTNRIALMALGSGKTGSIMTPDQIDHAISRLRQTVPPETYPPNRELTPPVPAHSKRPPEVEFLLPSDGCAWVPPATKEPELDTDTIAKCLREKKKVDVFFGADAYFANGKNPHFNVRSLTLPASGRGVIKTAAGDQYQIVLQRNGAELILQQEKGHGKRRAVYRQNKHMPGRFDGSYAENSPDNTQLKGFVVIVPAAQ